MASLRRPSRLALQTGQVRSRMANLLERFVRGPAVSAARARFVLQNLCRAPASQAGRSARDLAMVRVAQRLQIEVPMAVRTVGALQVDVMHVFGEFDAASVLAVRMKLQIPAARPP